MVRNTGNRRWTTERWESHLGEQIRRARQDAGLSQSDLADLANVNRNSISSLERGEGSTLATVIKAVRALGRADWLDTLAPEPGPSPLALLREQQTSKVQRVRSRLREDTGA